MAMVAVRRRSAKPTRRWPVLVVLAALVRSAPVVLAVPVELLWAQAVADRQRQAALEAAAETTSDPALPDLAAQAAPRPPLAQEAPTQLAEPVVLAGMLLPNPAATAGLAGMPSSMVMQAELQRGATVAMAAMELFKG